MTPDGKGSMSAEHKAALAEGRTQSKAVRQYLEALEAHKPKRGRKRTPESIKKRLDTIDGQLDSVDPLKRLQLVQERMDLRAELDNMEDKPDLDALAKGFTSSAKAYGARKGITYAAWRELGVDASVLKAAGITRGQPEPRAVAAGQAIVRVAARTEVSSGRPSSDPSRAELARSGWGMSPTTLPASLRTPAMSSMEPLGLST